MEASLGSKIFCLKKKKKRRRRKRRRRSSSRRRRRKRRRKPGCGEIPATEDVEGGAQRGWRLCTSHKLIVGDSILVQPLVLVCGLCIHTEARGEFSITSPYSFKAGSLTDSRASVF